MISSNDWPIKLCTNLTKSKPGIMNKTPVDWEEFEAQAVLIQRLISDQLSSPDSPHFISKLSEPEGLIKLNFDSPLTQIPALAFTNHKDSPLDEKFPFKSKELAKVRSPLKNVTNSSLQNQTPDHPKGGSALPSSAEFREFLSKISEISSAVQDSDISQDLNTSDLSAPIDRNHVRKGTYDVDDSNAKTETNESNKGVTRGRTETFDMSPSSSFLAGGIKDFADDSLVVNKNEDVFVEARVTVAPVRRLIPPVLTSCSLDDCDTDLTTSDESSDEDQPEETIPAAELLVVIDDVQAKTSSVKKKSNSKKSELKIKSSCTKDKPAKTVDDQSTSCPLLALSSEETPEQVSTDNKGATCKGSNLVSDDISNVAVEQPVSSDGAPMQDLKCDNTVIKSESCSDLLKGDIDTSVPCESSNNSLAQCNEISSIHKASSTRPSTRLVPKNMNTSSGSEIKPASKIIKSNSQIKRSSLAPQVQAKDNVVERRSLGNTGPSIKSVQTKPSQIQTKSSSKRDSIENSGASVQSSGLGGNTVKAGDSVLSKTVTKTQPTVPRVSQKNNRLQPPQQSKQIKSPIKPAVSEPETNRKIENGNTVTRPSLLQSRPSFSRGMLPPPKALLKPPLVPSKSIQEPVKAPQESSKIAIKASLTSSKTLKLVKPGFTKLPKPGGAVASLNDSTKVKDNKHDASHGPGDGDSSKKPVAVDDCKRNATQLLARKGPAPVKAIFPPSGLKVISNDSQAEVSRTVTKEKNDLPRVITDHQIQDGSRTVTKGKPDSGGCRTVTLSSESKSSSPSEVNSHFTPMKSEKVFNPRRLSDVFQSSFSPESAKGEKNGKISKIPTPRSSRLSSSSSLVSSSSLSSFRKPSDFESPFAGRKDSTEDSLSAFKPKHPLVRYTPDVEPRRQSMWSPVKRKPVPVDEMAFFCTKKLLPGQKPSS